MRFPDFEYLVFAAVIAFVGFVWFELGRTTGVLGKFDDDSFTICSFLAGEKRIKFADVCRPALMRERLFPRLSIRVASKGPFNLNPQHTLVLRGRNGEDEVIETLRSTVGIQEVRIGR